MTQYKFTKNGSLERPRNIDKDTFVSSSYGTEFTYELAEKVLTQYNFSSSNFLDEDYRKFQALKNIISYYSADDGYKKYSNFYNKPITMLCLNSYHLGDGIEKGSVYLGYYYTGSVIDYAQDKRTNGVLYNKNDEEVGIVLYKEGFIILNHTGALNNQISSSFTGSHYTSSVDYPRWIYFGMNDNDQKLFVSSPEYSLIDKFSSNLVLVEANKNTLNHSNNISYLNSSSISQDSYGFYASYPNYFKENDKISINNNVSSPFVSGTANFEKETYITKIGLYDKDKKLIGYASLATPVRKTENREFLFKLKIDI